MKGKIDRSALVIKPEWCDQIFDHGKVWEIRDKRCNKRGRFAIACSGTGTLVGEATMVDCLRVGRIDQDTGTLVPYSNKKEDCELFIGRPDNFPKHRISDPSDCDIIKTYSTVYAWVMCDAVRYAAPKPYVHTRGAQGWVRLDHDEASRDALKRRRRSSCSDGTVSWKRRRRGP